MTGTEAQRRLVREARRQFFAVATSAGLFAAGLLNLSPAVAQTTRAVAPAARPQPAAAGQAPRGNAPVVQAQGVPLNQVTPRVTNAPAQTAAIKPNPTQLQVMAVVNGDQISQADLGRECLWRFGKEVLEGMINRQLIAEACSQKKITITAQDIEQEIERIAQKFGLPKDKWMQLLRDERGFSESQYKREVVWPMLALRRLSADKTQVTQEEMQKAYESEFGPKVRALLIVHSQKQMAERLLAEANANPATFRDLSKQYSDDPGVASAYGVIPPIRMHMGDANLERIAFSLKPNQVSPVIQVADKYYILKCEEQIEGRMLPADQMTAYQAKLQERLKEGKLRGVAANFFEEMNKSSQIVNYYSTTEELRKSLPPGTVATVNNRPITTQALTEECLSRYGQEVLEGEISRKVLSQELAKKKLEITQQDLDEEVARAAEMYGVTDKDGKPDVKRWLEQITEQEKAPKELYIRDAVWPSVALKKIVGNQVIITEEDLQKAYESNYGERVEVLAIVCGDQRQAQRVWDMARNNPKDSFFAELAEQYSVEPSSRSNGGKVPPIQRHSGSPEMEKEAFSLKAGQISGIVAVNGQFIIMRCLGRTTPVSVDQAVARKALHKDLEERKLRANMSREFDRLLQTSQIDNYIAGTSQSGKERANGKSPFTNGAVAPAGGASAPRTAGGVAPVSNNVPRSMGTMKK
ncbi:peptidylprolyl isomerase [Anatilimnocola floriformis]|uniref:peptidylprolyl isomerase n=1 Tax=Anatilimnocola floriformis TaxID=2948575 RepID=UPI0020C305A0|nr:peptidylprolyl isomerase [Anatilimnocola floriformis]